MMMMMMKPLVHLPVMMMVFLLLLSLLELSGAAEFGVGFSRWPEWEVVGVPGSSVSLPCATNVTADKISWNYNHHFLLSPSPPTAPSALPASFHMQAVEGGSELMINLAERESQYKPQLGLYQCVAWFGAVALTSLPGRLRAAVLEPYPEDEVEVVEVEVEEGGAARVECGLPPSVPEAILHFYKDGQLLDIQQDNAAYHLTPHGDLVLVGVGAWAAGEYSCSAHNTALNSSVDRNSRTAVRVVQQSQQAQQPSPPHFVTLRSVYSGSTGSNVTLLCLANGHPKPILRWTKYGGSLPPSSIQTDGSLMIFNVKVEDEGTYLCHAENEVGAQENVLDMVLEVIDPPRLVADPASQEVEEGLGVTLTCAAQGHPQPKIMWVFNGRLVRSDGNIIITESELIITAVEKEHAGIFQCFAHNPQGTVQGLAMITVVPRTVTAPPNGTMHHHPVLPDTPTVRVPSNRRRKGEEVEEEGQAAPRGERKGKKKKGRMVPPSRPRIAKVTDESVMVTWTAPKVPGLPVRFYKIQYKMLGGGGRGNQWMTVDEDILPHIHSFEVTGLHTGRTYKFRLAAVYSNHDNARGRTSRRFLLQRSEQLQPPATPPIITQLLPRGPSSVSLTWEYHPTPGVPIEGFFVNYREATMAGDYTKVTVLEPDIRSHVIDHLKANVSYDFKMQVFNLAGASDYSPVFKKSAVGPVSMAEGSGDREEMDSDNGGASVVRPAIGGGSGGSGGDPVVSNLQLYIILGAVLGGLFLIVVVSAAVYSCRHSHIDDDTRSNKYEDTSLHIHREVSTFTLPEDPHNHHHHNSNGRHHNGYLPHQTITVTPQDIDKASMESSLTENNNHDHQPLERCYASPARRIATQDPCPLKAVPLLRHNDFEVGGREVIRS